MTGPRKHTLFVAGTLLLHSVFVAVADEVKILATEFHSIDGKHWTINVTLQHADTGWDHYADNWRVVDTRGKVLGDRVLFHPHVNEQPFTRSLGNLVLPENMSTVFIEAHDKVHGWTPRRLKVDITQAVNKRLKVEAN